VTRLAELQASTSAAILLLSFVGAGCGLDHASPSPTPSVSLVSLPADAGCETQLINYESITFHLDPGEPVTASAPGGHRLRTAWDRSFHAGSGAELVVYDSAGQIVARDGEIVLLPERNRPLHGHLLCVGIDYVWIFGADPT
jgi:hypothetical protein